MSGGINRRSKFFRKSRFQMKDLQDVSGVAYKQDKDGVSIVVCASGSDDIVIGLTGNKCISTTIYGFSEVSDSTNAPSCVDGSSLSYNQP